jgi:hypothetical protein
MLVACRLAGLSALETHYAGSVALRQSGAMTAARVVRTDQLIRAWSPPGHLRALAIWRDDTPPSCCASSMIAQRGWPE